MNVSSNSTCPVVIAIAICSVVSGCDRTGRYVPAAKPVDVEISPGKFITVEEWVWSVDDPKNPEGEKTRLRIRYGGHVITWEGVGIPVILREKDGTLYMVVYDRGTSLEPRGTVIHRYHYYRQHKDNMESIAAATFPKEIATQNMWVSDDRLDAVLNLDTSDLDFLDSVNASIWEDIMTGKVDQADDVETLLNEYKRKYKPSKLTAIRRPAASKK
jgi:hypothetical protein